jgi:hypothetical protein
MDELTPDVRKTLELMQMDLEAKQSVADEQVLQKTEDEQGAGTSLQKLFGTDALEPVDRAMDAIGAGALRAGFETYDFLAGEPEEADKTDVRRGVEAQDRALKRKSIGYGLASGVSQMVVGLVGAGKLLAPVKAIKEVAGGKAAFEVARGAVASTFALDPHEERLSNLIQEFPDLENPVTDFLAADIEDTEAEGRFKNALESIGLDYALLGALKTIKFLRAGDTAAASKEIGKLEAANQNGAGSTVAPLPEGDMVPAYKDGAPPAANNQNNPARTLSADNQNIGVSPGNEALDLESPSTYRTTGEAAPAYSDGVPPAAANQNAGPLQAANQNGVGSTVAPLPEGAPVPAFSDGAPPAAANQNAAPTPPPVGKPQAANGNSRAAPVAKAAPGGDVVREQIGTKAPEIDPKTGEPILPTQKVGPDEVRTQDIADADLTSILKGAKQDAEAIKKYGSKDAAAAGGHKFSRTTKLPWQKLRTTVESRALLERTADILRPRFDKIKGGSILKDAKVRLLVDDIASLYGNDPAHILGQLAEAGAAAPRMVANMEASLLIGNRMLNDVDELAARIRVGNVPEFRGDLFAAGEALKGQLAVALDTLAAGNSILANSARTMRRARGQFRIRAKDLAALQAMDPEKVIIVLERAKGDPKKLAQMVSGTWQSRVMDEAIFHLTNGLLWMWPTHLVNTTTNAIMLAARPTEKLFGSAALRLITKDPGKLAELSSVSRQALKEYTYTVASLADGWHNAVEAFRRGDSILNPHHTEYFDVGIQTQSLPWRPVQGVADIAHNAWMSASYRNLTGLPTRALGAADEFFKTMRYRAVIQARASVAAADRGLTGVNAERFIQKSMDEAMDPETGRAVDAAAIRESQTVSFQQDLNYETTIGGSFGRSLQSARKSSPALAIILPFVKTPVNVIRYGIKLTPGLNLAQKEFRDAFKGIHGAEAQAHAYGQMSMASMFGGLAAYLALNGRITGSGPDDFKLKQELLATGWKPFSVVGRNEDGTTTYYQLGRFDPVAMPFSMVADIVENMKKKPDADFSAHMTAVAVAMAKNLGEKTFLLNLNSAMEAFLNPDDGRLGKWAGRTAANMLPASSLMRGMSPDPYLREARTFVDSLIRGVPGLQEGLAVTLDVYGDPVERYVGVWDTQDADVVEAEHNRIMLQTDKGIGKPDPQFEGVDLRDIRLESGVNAYQRYQELVGHPKGQKSLKAALKDLIESDAYQDLVDGDSALKGTRINAIGRVVGKYREWGRKLLLRESQMLRDQVGTRQREVVGAYQTKKAGREPGAVELLNVLRP